MTVPPSELAVVAPGVLKLAREGAPLHAIMDAMLAGSRPIQSRAPEPSLPVPVGGLSDDARLALKVLPDVYGQVNLDSRRPLTDAERAVLGQEDLALRILMGDLTRRADVIKEMIRVHADAEAEERNQVVPRDQTGFNPQTGQQEVIVEATPRDDKGHYLHASAPKQAHQIPIPGTPKAWSLEYHGNGVDYDLSDLLRMRIDREITQAEFNAMTRPVVDEAKISAFMVRKPARALQILGRIARLKTPSNYLYVRTQK